MEIILFFLSFIFVFGLVIFVHEFGHFIAAKRSGIEVQEFAFGFPPTIFKKKVKGTVYSVNLIPFGGFVRILGEDGSDPDNPKSFANKKKLTKAKVISAGVVMNFILAWVIFSFLYVIGFLPLIPGMDNHKWVSQHFYIANVQEGTPASNQGIIKKDEILTINGVNIKNIDVFTNQIKENIGKEISVDIKRGSEKKTFSITPYKEEVDGKEIGRLGVEISRKVKADNIFFAPIAGLIESLRIVFLTFTGIVGFFVQLFTTFSINEGFAGPVGIAVITNEISKLGFTFLLQFIAVLSVSLALFNILPIPALDGGHLMFLAIEKIRGKDVSDKFKNTATLVGFFLLILLLIIITPRDLSRFGVIDGIKNFLGI